MDVQQRGRQIPGPSMTDEECERRVSAIRSEARTLVPEWEPWMTQLVGYAGLGLDWTYYVQQLDMGYGPKREVQLEPELDGDQAPTIGRPRRTARVRTT